MRPDLTASDRPQQGAVVPPLLVSSKAEQVTTEGARRTHRHVADLHAHIAGSRDGAARALGADGHAGGA
jgi:hypothetical protein